MAVSKRLRYEILRRDNHTCRYCGAAAPEATLVVDHYIPVVVGGATVPSNLVTACEPCNSGKSSVVIEELETCDDTTGLAGSCLTSAILAVWAARWRKADGGRSPSAEHSARAFLHIQSGTAAGYDDLAVKYAAWQAGGHMDSEVVNYFTTAPEALSRMAGGPF